MNVWELFEPDELQGPVKEKLRKLLEDLEVLKATDQTVYFKFLYALGQLTKSSIDVSTQTNLDQTENNSESEAQCERQWSSDITNEVKAVAEETVSQSGFVFDRQTGSYYNHVEQCYYIPDYKLYYYAKTGAYYYYDEDSQSLKYYSSVSTEDQKGESSPSQCVPKTESKKADSEKEDGECSDDEEGEEEPSQIVIQAGPKSFEPDHNKHIAPCIRFIVKSTDLTHLSVGKLFIVTRTGGTLGREGKHDILIPDRNVSKFHALFRYKFDHGEYNYCIVDVGSKNGTFLNGNRLSDSLTKSEAVIISHGCTLTVGSTDLLCHIHDGDKTCLECEPSSAGFSLETENPLKNRSLKEQHNFEENQIRKKFGLSKGVNHFRTNKKYEDRSEIRRHVEGSTHDSEKTEVATIDTAITDKNKGFKLLSKMGWKEGEALGKEQSQGLIEPIVAVQPRGKRGLGSTVDEMDFSFTERTKKEIMKDNIMNKTRKRFYNIEGSPKTEQC